MSKALIVAHEAEYGRAIAGYVGEGLEARGFDLAFHGILDPGGTIDTDLPAPEDFDLIVVFGSFHHAYDEADKSWLDPERAWITRAIEAQVAYLGICFGAQLLAQVIGGSVEAAPAIEAGAMTMDAVGQCPIPLGPWFTWHGDRMVLPDSVTLWATTSMGPQIFRVGNALGIQFHPEATPELIRAWLDVGGDHLEPDHSAETVWNETQAATSAMKDNAMVLVDWVIEALVKQ